MHNRETQVRYKFIGRTRRLFTSTRPCRHGPGWWCKRFYWRISPDLESIEGSRYFRQKLLYTGSTGRTVNYQIDTWDYSLGLEWFRSLECLNLLAYPRNVEILSEESRFCFLSHKIWHKIPPDEGRTIGIPFSCHLEKWGSAISCHKYFITQYRLYCQCTVSGKDYKIKIMIIYNKDRESHTYLYIPIHTHT